MGLVNSLKKFVGYEEEDDDFDYNENDDIDEGGSVEDDFSFKRSSNMRARCRRGFAGGCRSRFFGYFRSLSLL